MNPQPNSRVVNLRNALDLFNETWQPKVIAELNDIQFKLAKLHGSFVWHVHDHADEAFMVVRGMLEIGFRDHTVVLNQGELYVVPKGVEHITRAHDLCEVLIIEKRGVVNTGDAGGTLTAPNNVWL